MVSNNINFIFHKISFLKQSVMVFYNNNEDSEIHKNHEKLFNQRAFLTVGQVKRENAEQRVRKMLKSEITLDKYCITLSWSACLM